MQLYRRVLDAPKAHVAPDWHAAGHSRAIQCKVDAIEPIEEHIGQAEAVQHRYARRLDQHGGDEDGACFDLKFDRMAGIAVVEVVDGNSRSQIDPSSAGA